MSEPKNLHQALVTMTVHRALWGGRIVSAFVVIALVVDGTIQLFAPAQIASLLQETGFAMDLTRVVGSIVLACAILYAIPGTAVPGAILVPGFLGAALCAHVGIGEWRVAAGNHFPADLEGRKHPLVSSSRPPNGPLRRELRR